MQEKAKEPEIRFAGFTGAWEQRKFGEMANRRSEVSASGNLPRVEYEDIVSGTGTLNKDVFEKQSQKQGIVFHSGDVLYGKLRPYLQNWLLASFNGLAVGDFWVLEPQGLNSNYLYRIIQTKQFDEIANQSVGTKMPRADWKLVSKATFLNPASFNEQRLIGKFFKDIDSLLTLHQRKYEKLLNIKKSMLEKMFPKEGEVVPEIRFKGFTGAWEQRVLGDFLEVSMETNSSAKFDKNDVLSISGDYGVVNQIAFQGRSFASNSVVKYGVLHNEDIVYTKSPLKANPYGIIKTNKGKAGIVSPLYAIYHPKNNLVPSFVQSYFEQNERLNNYLRPLVNKGAKNNMLISNEKAISGKVIFPSRKEQEKISALLERVDSLLTLHQRKLEMLKNVKQAFLEKMFV